MQRVRQITFTLVLALAVGGFAVQAFAQTERFEVTSLKAVRPTLVNTGAALQAGDVARAKAAFDAFDSAWNGIEVYVNTRNKEAYETLEHEFQPRITKALKSANPNLPATTADVQAMLAKFDATVAAIAAMKPLNSFYDEIARLRIVRAHLREVPPALKAGDFARARKSFQNFDDNWDSIEDLIKARNAESYVAIEKNMIAVEKALTPAKPDAAQVTAMVNEIMRLYNDALVAVAKDARAKQ